jgi:hypothetical protein
MGTFSLWHLIIIFLAIFAIAAPPYWTLQKAGWSGWWCFIFVVPIANLIFLWVFAFARWPNEPSDEGVAIPQGN